MCVAAGFAGLPGESGSALAEWRQNWKIVVAAAAGVALSTMMSYSGGVFLQPIQDEFGWSRGQIMTGSGVAAITGVLCAPFTGLVVDRIGPRRIGIAAVFAACIAAGLLGLATADIWVWRALWVPVAFSVILIQPSVWTAAVTSLFAKGRGFALAVALCGASLSSVVTPPLSYFLIEELGWRLAWPALGACFAVLTLPFIYFWFSSQADRVRLAPKSQIIADPPTKPSLRESGMLSWRFLQLLLSGMGIAGVVVTLGVSVVPILSANGLTRLEAASIASLLGIASICGRLGIGFLLDRMDGRVISAIVAALPIAGILILVNNPGSVPMASMAVLILGLSLGAELDMMAYLASRYFNPQNFGFLFGTIGGFIGLASSIGPIALNYSYDYSQSYTAALLGAIPLCVIAALLFLTLGPYPDAKPHQLA